MIRNRTELTAHGNSKAREALLDIVDHALERVHPEALVPDVVTTQGTELRVADTAYDLAAIDDIHVIGAGKGSLAVVSALLDRLPGRVETAIAVEKHGQGEPRKGIEIFETGHPIPDENGVRASERVVEVAQSIGMGDLVFACITGGTSAQLPYPPDGISVDELAELTELLLHAGLSIDEINTVRKHVSQIKGGQLTELIAPATLVTLVVVDEVQGEPWGPTIPDKTTFEDAGRILKDRGLWSETPMSIREYLQQGIKSTELETPNGAELATYPTQTVVLADATDACEAGRDRAAELGYTPLILSTMIEGESAEVGAVHAGIAKEAVRHDRPVEPPCAIVSGGETTVTVDKAAGRGGPNQEFAVRFALEIAEWPTISAIAVGTDGTDGPTDIAGGVVDASSTAQAESEGVKLRRRLHNHDVSGALEQIGDAVYTGSTGTNVMDLRVVLVTPTDD
jgi:glycerate-2-kinase